MTSPFLPIILWVSSRKSGVIPAHKRRRHLHKHVLWLRFDLHIAQRQKICEKLWWYLSSRLICAFAGDWRFRGGHFRNLMGFGIHQCFRSTRACISIAMLRCDGRALLCFVHHANHQLEIKEFLKRQRDIKNGTPKERKTYHACACDYSVIQYGVRVTFQICSETQKWRNTFKMTRIVRFHSNRNIQNTPGNNDEQGNKFFGVHVLVRSCEPTIRGREQKREQMQGNDLVNKA